MRLLFSLATVATGRRKAERERERERGREREGERDFLCKGLTAAGGESRAVTLTVSGSQQSSDGRGAILICSNWGIQAFNILIGC